MDYEKIASELSVLSLSELNQLMGYIEESFPEVLEAKWTAAYMNDLPDSSFMLVRRPVKDKAKDRALPVRDKTGKVDVAHLRNALARVNQVKGFSPEAVASARRKLQALAKKHLGKKESIELDFAILMNDIKALGESINSLKPINESLADQIEEVKEEVVEETSLVVDDLVEEMVKDGVIEESEADSTKEFFQGKDEETVKELIEEVKKEEVKAVVIEKIQDPTLVLDDKPSEARTKSEEVKDDECSRLIELIKRGDSNAEKKLSRLLEDKRRSIKRKS